MLKEAEKEGNKIQEQNPKINPNKAGFFESSFSGGGGGGSILPPLHISRRTNLLIKLIY